MTENKTFTVLHSDGKVEHVPMTAADEAAFKKFAEWDGWCRCENSESGETVERGHSADLYCRNCGGVICIG